MIIVDDHGCLEVMAGRRERLSIGRDERVATTWGFHYRLVRALNDADRVGALSGVAGVDVLERVLAAHPGELEVLDPRPITGSAATIAVRHGLNLLAAELLGAALQHRATVVLSRTNVGRRWPAVFAAEQVTLRIAAPT